MIIRNPNFKMFLPILQGINITIGLVLVIPFILGKNPVIFLKRFSGEPLESLFVLILAINLVTIIAIVFFYIVGSFIGRSVVIIEENTKAVTVVYFLLCFFKFKEYKFNGRKVYLAIKSVVRPRSRSCWSVWILYFFVENRELEVAEYIFKKSALEEAKKIAEASGCKLDLVLSGRWS